MAVIHHRISFLGIALLLLCLCTHCDIEDEEDDYCDNYDYSDCITEEPDSGLLELYVTINKENPKVALTIFKGRIEDNDMVIADSTETASYEFNVLLDEYYSAKAVYKSGNKTIIAIDGDRIRKSSSKTCDSTCWSVHGGYINLRLHN